MCGGGLGHKMSLSLSMRLSREARAVEFTGIVSRNVPFSLKNTSLFFDLRPRRGP